MGLWENNGIWIVNISNNGIADDHLRPDYLSATIVSYALYINEKQRENSHPLTMLLSGLDGVKC